MAPNGATTTNKQPLPLPLPVVGPPLFTTAGLLCCCVTAGEELTVGLGLADTGDWDATGVDAALVGAGAGTDETCETWETCPPVPDTWDEWDE
jgi:hypothetical protein